MKNHLRLLLMAAILAMLLFGCAQSSDSQENPEETQGGFEIEAVTDEMDVEDAETESEEENESEKETEEAEQEGAFAQTDLAEPIRIWGVVTDAYEGVIVVDNQSEVSSSGEMELIIGDETYVLDASTGLPVLLDEVETGSFEAYLGAEMTMSLPPQTTPYMVIVNIPEDSRTPQYAIAAEVTEEDDGSLTLTATDGRVYGISDSAQITPYLTKNIVTMDDIRVGISCLIWADDENTAETVMIFAQ
ncbi:MAG: hypothetical protein LUE24_06470 [Lachnospiraceae bacterium]|nr:hypothetical protein [Lachnospiraceae bacterium]